MTTGGQQVIDLVCKTLIDPGDVIVAEAPTYPGAVPTFSAYQADVEQIEIDADGMPIDALESTLDRLQAQGRRPKFIYTIPNFQNPGGVTMSLARRRRLVEVARERELLVLEDNPYGLLRYEGEPLPTLYSLDADAAGRGGASDLVIYLGTFSKILSPGLRLGWAVAPRPVLEKLNLGKQGADLCSSPVTQMFVAAYFDERDAHGEPALARVRGAPQGPLPAPQGRDARGARRALRRGRELDAGPQGGLFIWATLDERIDTTDLLALARKSESVAFVPGRAAYVDGRSGSSSMRLNFAGRPRRGHPRGHPADRQGDARAARAARIAHRLRRARGHRAPAPQSPAAGGAAMRRSWRTSSRCRAATSAATAAPAPGSMTAAKRVAVLKGGRSLERAVSLRSGAHVQDGLQRLGHEVVAIDVGAELVPRAARGRAPTPRSSRCTAATARTGPCRGCWRRSGCPTRARGRRRACAAPTRLLAKYLMREAGIPTPAFHALRETAIKELGAAAALAGIERSLGFPLVVKPAKGGSALGVKFARTERGAARRDRRRVLLRPHDPARALRQGPRPGGVGARARRRHRRGRRGGRAGGAAGRRGGPARRGASTTTSRATRSA